MILAGDHCQLPPTVNSIAALRAGLGKTLMERIAENKPEVVTLLKDLRRMNVAMTRACRKLIILGNNDTLTKHPFYNKLWEYVEAINNHE